MSSVGYKLVVDDVDQSINLPIGLDNNKYEDDNNVDDDDKQRKR
jgi:hypothetical protein